MIRFCHYLRGGREKYKPTCFVIFDIIFVTIKTLSIFEGDDMTRREMTSRERVLAVLKRQPYDRVPVINPASLANVESMRLAGAFFPNAHTNSMLWRRCAPLAMRSSDLIV